MGVSVYRWDGAGAPQLQAVAGNLIAVLDYALVTGKGWTKVFSATNKAVYRPPQGNRFYLRVDDTGTTDAQVKAYETMSDVDTGTGTFPAGTTQYNARKAASVDGINRRWVIVADEKLFHMWAQSDTNLVLPTNGTYLSFGDLRTLLPGDAYCTILSGANSTGGMTNMNLASSISGSTTGLVFARGHGQAPGSQTGGYSASIYAGGSFGAGGMAFPSPYGADFKMGRITTHDTTTPSAGVRAIVPGMWAAFHQNGTLVHLDTFSGAAGTDLAGRTFIYIRVAASYALVLETSDTWYT